MFHYVPNVETFRAGFAAYLQHDLYGKDDSHCLDSSVLQQCSESIIPVQALDLRCESANSAEP